MKRALWLGIACALLLHAGFLLFGGLLFPDEPEAGELAVVELVTEELEQTPEPEAPVEAAPVAEDELHAEAEEPPDAEELIRSMEQPAGQAAMPELEAASLAAIEAALSGQAAGGRDGFAQSLDFSSGGAIGGTGRAAPAASVLESAFSLADIDQKPRAVFQAAPGYPASMRGRKVEAVVTVVFVVNGEGAVESPRVEKSTHAAFDKPALDAVRQWKFEPAIKAGRHVPCRMRVPVRFQPS